MANRAYFRLVREAVLSPFTPYVNVDSKPGTQLPEKINIDHSGDGGFLGAELFDKKDHFQIMVCHMARGMVIIRITLCQQPTASLRSVLAAILVQ